MIKSSCKDGKKSWENQIAIQSQEVENRGFAPFDSQLSHFIRACRKQETPLRWRRRTEGIDRVQRRALDGEGHGAMIDIDNPAMKSRL
jgi:hypothetical protein